MIDFDKWSFDLIDDIVHLWSIQSILIGWTKYSVYIESSSSLDTYELELGLEIHAVLARFISIIKS